MFHPNDIPERAELYVLQRDPVVARCWWGVGVDRVVSKSFTMKWKDNVRTSKGGETVLYFDHSRG